MAVVVVTGSRFVFFAACSVHDEPLTRGVFIRFWLICERKFTSPDATGRRPSAQTRGGRRCRVATWQALKEHE